MYEEYLTHHGVLGMKWGIRRYQNKDGTLTPAGRRRLKKLEAKQEKIARKQNRITGRDPIREAKDAAKQAEETRRSKLSEFSDQELQSAINRLRNEKAYMDLMKERYNMENPSPKVKEPLLNGRKIAGDILTNAFTERGKDLANYAIGSTLNKLAQELGAKGDVSKVGYKYIENARKEAKAKEKARADKLEQKRRKKDGK